MHVITFPLLIILTSISIIDWIWFRPERVAAVTLATSRWRPRTLSACSDTLTSKEQSFHVTNLPPCHKKRDGACGKSLIKMMENKNHLNTNSNNDNKDEVPRKWHFGCRACVMRVCCGLSQLWLLVTPRTSAHQAPLPMGFSRQEYWNGLPSPPPGDLHNPGIKPMSLKSPVLGGTFFTTSATRKLLTIERKS